MSKEQTQWVTGSIVEEEVELTLGELCRRCQVEADFIVELVQEGVIDPLSPSAQRWTFSGHSLTRLRRARNLHRDLGLNLAGVALVIELLEERERLYRELAHRRQER